MNKNDIEQKEVAKKSDLEKKFGHEKDPDLTDEQHKRIKKEIEKEKEAFIREQVCVQL